MRHFYSYGPVDAERHFSVPRLELVEQCLDFLVDDPDKGGHCFTIWAPRQTGKTWLMHQVMRAVQQRHGYEISGVRWWLRRLGGAGIRACTDRQDACPTILTCLLPTLAEYKARARQKR